MPVSGTIEQAQTNSYYFTDSLTDDVLLRALSSNSWLIGGGSNTTSTLKIHKNTTTVNASNLIVNAKLGINNVSPTYDLDITGTANATNIYEGATLLSSKYALSNIVSSYLPLAGGTLTGTLTGTTINAPTFNGSNASFSNLTVPGTLTVVNITDCNMVASNVAATRYFAGPTADTVSAPGYTWSNDLTTGMYHPAASNIAFTIAGTEEMRLTSTGLGINTTPTVALDVSGRARISSNIGQSTVSLFNVENPSSSNGISHFVNLPGTSWNGIVKAGDSAILGSMGAADTGSLVVGLWGSSNQGIRIDKSGSVGIGNSNTTYKLDVAGTANATTLYEGGTLLTTKYALSNGMSNYLLSSTAGTTYALSNGMSNYLLSSTAGTTYALSNVVSNYLPLSGGTLTSNLTITNTGNTKLRFTNDTSTNRHIVLWDSASNEHVFYGIGVNPSLFRFQVDTSTSDYAFNIGVNSNSSSELMRIKGTGNVGIGTSNPSYKLDVSGTANASTLYESGTLLTSKYALSNAPLLPLAGGTLTGTLTGTTITAPTFNGSNANFSNLTVPGTLTVVNITDCNMVASNVFATRYFAGSATDTVSAPGYTWSNDLTTGMYHPSTSNIAFTISGTEEMRITSTGLGIGTSNPASPLDVQNPGNGNEVIRIGTERPWVFKQSGTGSTANTTLQSTAHDKAFIINSFGSVNLATFYSATISGNCHVKLARTTVGSTSVVGPVNGLYVEGNTGLGIDPSYKLDVSGTTRSTNILVGTSTDTTRFISCLDSNMSNNTQKYITFGKSNSLKNQAELSYTHTGDGSDSNVLSLQFYGVPEILNITSGANVGIGTSNPSYKLHVSGTANATTLSEGGSNLTTKYALSNVVSNYLPLSGGTITNDLTTQGFTYISKNNGGGVPAFTFGGALAHNSTNGFGGLDYIDCWMNSNTFDPSYISHAFWTLSNSTLLNRMVISKLGNVGIGTLTPSYKLDVSGDINFTGNLRQNGSIFTSGGGGVGWTNNTSNIYSLSNIGIGTSNPSYTFDVSGTANATTIREGGTLLSAKYAQSNTLSNYLPLAGGNITGNLGMGIAGPGKNLHIFNATSEAGIRVESGDSANASNAQLYLVAKSNGINALAYYNRPLFIGRSTNGNDISGTTQPTIVMTTGDLVGIGTSNPSYKLDVSGTANVTTMYEGGTLLTTKYAQSNILSNYLLSSTAGTTYALSNVVSNYLPLSGGFLTSNLTITNNSNTKLRFTNDTSTNRHIVLWDSASNEHVFYGIGVNPSLFRFQVDTSTSDYAFNVGVNSNSSSELMRIKGTGNVGIGTSNPSYKLDVNGTANATTIREGGTLLTSKYIQKSGDTGIGTLFMNSSNSLWITNNGDSNARMRVHHSGTDAFIDYWSNLRVRAGAGAAVEYFTFTSNGSLGISTSNPSYKLDVSGTANASTLYESGTLLTSKYALSNAPFLPLAGGTLTGTLTGTTINAPTFNGSNASFSNLTVPGTLTVVNITDCNMVASNVVATRYLAGPVADTVSAPGHTWSNDLTTGMYRPASSTIAFTLGGTEEARLTTTGLGLNTTPAYQLDVNGTSLIRNGNGANQFSNNQLLLGWNGTNTFMHTIKSRHFGGADNTDNAIDFYVWQTSDSNNVVGTKQAMSVTSTGVGIGSTAPGKNLHIFNATSEVGIRVESGDTANASNAQLYLAAKSNGINALAYYNRPLVIGRSTDGTNVSGTTQPTMVMTTGDLIGIGTSNPSYKLDVSGTMRVTSTATFDSGIALGGISGDPNPIITARVVPSGQGSSNEKTEMILFHSNDPENGSGVDTITLRAPGLRFQTYNDATVSNITNSNGANDRMYISPTGNVGIGTTTPSYTLDANGTINATNVREGGTLLTTKYALSNVVSNYLPLSGGTITGTLTANDTLFINKNAGATSYVPPFGFNGAMTFNTNNGFGGIDLIDCWETFEQNYYISHNFAIRSNNAVVSRMTINKQTGDVTINNGLTVTKTTRTKLGIIGDGVHTASSPGAPTTTGLILTSSSYGSMAAPHISVYTANESNPSFNLLNWSSNNTSLNFDLYYNNGWKNSGTTSPFQLYKLNNRLHMVYGTAGSANSNAALYYGLTLDNAGSVGINNANPITRFDTTGAGRFTKGLHLGTSSNISGILGYDTNSTMYIYGSDTDNTPWQISSLGGNLNFNRYGSGNNVTINNTLNGVVTVSDRRLKSDIIDMRSTKELLMNLKPREFVWNENNGYSYGFIAQEVYEYFPEMRPIFENTRCTCTPENVSRGILCDAPEHYHDEPVDNDGKPLYYGLDYGKFTPYIIKAQQETIQDLEMTQAELAEANLKIQTLESKIEKLEMFIKQQFPGFE